MLDYVQDCPPPVEKADHSHPPNPVDIEKRKLENRVKELAGSTNNTPRRVVQDAVVGASQEVAAAVGSATNLREMVRRKRKRQDDHPPNPGNRADVVVPPNLRRTRDGRPFLLFDSGLGDGHRMLIFSTEELLQRLENAEVWMCDGTFKISPSLFYQLYTVHAVIRNNVLPCVFALLPSKAEPVYRSMWREIKTLNNDLSPRAIQIDFENAAMNALHHAFPRAEILGCYFHLGQSIWRSLQNHGLRNLYIEDPDVRTYTRMLIALAFLPVGEVGEAFEDLVEDIPEALIPLSDYFEDTYIGRRNRRGERRAPRYPVAMWSVRSRQERGLPRTSNQLESWHNAMQGACQGQHPSIFRFIEHLQSEEALQNFNAAHLDQGRDLTQRMKKYQALNRRIQRVQENEPNLTRRQFLESISYNLEINAV